MPYNVAVVGYGLSAKVFHIPLILALPNDFKLYGIVQRSPKPEDDALKDHPGTKSYSAFDESIADPEVDVIVITTLPGVHFEMCKAALEAGKHVVVEKPFVPTKSEADALVQTAQRTGKQLAVYQNRRWDSDFVTLKNVLSQNILGDLAEFETHFDRHRPDPPAQTWKVVDAPGHGSIYDLGTHLIDQVYSLFGMPQRVTAFIDRQRRSVSGGSADCFTAMLHYPHLLVTAKAGVVSPEQEQLRFWVRGTKGSFKKYHLDPQEDQLKTNPAGAKLPSGFGVEDKSHAAVVTEWKDGKGVSKAWSTVSPPPTYVECYRLFAQALKGEGKVPVSAEEARDVLTIIEAAITSSKEGRTVDM
jgi:predicted dehydrogenase